MLEFLNHLMPICSQDAVSIGTNCLLRLPLIETLLFLHRVLIVVLRYQLSGGHQAVMMQILVASWAEMILEQLLTALKQ